MDNLFGQYSTSPSSSTTSTLISPSFPSSNVSISQQNVDPFQINNVHFSNNSGQPFSFPSSPFPTPNHSLPYNPVHTHPLMNQPHQDNFVPTEQSRDSLIKPNTFQIQAQMDDDRKKIEARRGKIASEQRKQKVQKHRIATVSKASEEKIRRQRLNQEVQHRTPHFFTLDGKRFEEILTKKLTKSDVIKSDRIVLPKMQAEKMLPTPIKEGIEVVFRDIYSPLEWKMKFRYWNNTKTRMYVLENTGDLVNHYKLRIGDHLILYEDKSKNMYLYIKKAFDDLSTVEQIPYGDHGKETESVNQQLSSNSMKLQVPNQLVGQKTNEITTSSVLDKTTSMDGDVDDDGGCGGGGGGEQHDNLDEFYESLGNIVDVY